MTVSRVIVNPFNFSLLVKLLRGRETPVAELPAGVEHCGYHVAPSALAWEAAVWMHLCQRHMMVVTRRNARLVPFATRSCDLGCQECLRADSLEIG